GDADTGRYRRGDRRRPADQHWLVSTFRRLRYREQPTIQSRSGHRRQGHRRLHQGDRRLLARRYQPTASREGLVDHGWGRPGARALNAGEPPALIRSGSMAEKRPARKPRATKKAPAKKASAKKASAKKTPASTKKATRKTSPGKAAPKLLSGGNPQIPKGDGD